MRKIYIQNNPKNMSIFEHLEELRRRFFMVLIIFCIITTLCLVNIKSISFILQEPALGIKFLQLAPGEYIFVSIKMSIYAGVVFSSPFAIYQIILFILPGLTNKEASYLIPTLITSIFLFFLGIIFSYKILIPGALNFLINYGSEIVEPIWSFEEYFNFILLLSFSTGLAFQIPVVQLLLGFFNIVSSKNMLKYWKYIIFISTVIGAVITPSTDPITQIFMSLAILTLYFSGILILKTLKR
uniref:Sec-independent protein translocase-like protein n=1 Tax=Cumathamnion serrulatum TaxID=1206573 RepID=A0A7U1AQZ1_9FLOR|nr:sec-independent protein translocase-like protein [Cumathamnion serrulatum]QQY85306.1 sec-independent protein translocase-like protein [Cumathamnion serrulatum]